MAIAIGLLKTLLELAETKKSGAIDVTGPGARVRIFVEDGEVVFAADGGVGETLGRLLLRERIITDEQYAAAIEWALERHDSGKEEKLGIVLVELKMLSQGQLLAALSAQVQRKVIRALGWANARVSFVEAYGLVDVDVRHITPVEPLVLAALKVASVAAVDELFAQARNRFPSLRTDGIAGASTLARLTAFRMPSADDAFARGLDGTRSVDEILEDGLERTRPDRASVLAALLVTDCLDLNARPRGSRAEWPPAPRSRPSLVGLGPVSADKPKSMRRPSIHPPSAGERAQAQKVTTRLKEAQEARRGEGPSSRDLAAEAALATPAASRLLAERAFQMGRRLIRSNQLAEAAKELRQAATLYEAPEYELWATWAEARRDPDGADLPALRDAAERALDQDPELGFAYFALGHIALAAGREAEANTLFERAKKLDPDTVERARDVRLRASPSALTTTRGEVRALAPLLTSDPHLDAALPASSDWDVAPQQTSPSSTRMAAWSASRPSDEVPNDEVPTEVLPRPANEIAKIPLARASAPPKNPDKKDDEKKSVPPPPPPSAPTPLRVPSVPVPTKMASAPAPAKVPLPPPSAPPSAPPSVPAKRSEVPAAPPISTPDVGKSDPPAAAKPASVPPPVPTPPSEPPEATNLTTSELVLAKPKAVPPPLPPPPSEPEASTTSEPPSENFPREAAPLSRISMSSRRPMPPRPPKRGIGIGTILFFLICAGMIAFAVTRRDEPQPQARPTPPPPSAIDAAEDTSLASVEPEAVDAALTQLTAAHDAGETHDAEPEDAAIKAVEDAAPPQIISVAPDRGALLFPPGAAGHRVYVDSRMVGQPPSPIVIPCGAHAVKVGSTGRTQNMLVPCGERVWVPYP